MMTEEQARKKWCPLAMTPNYISTTGAATNRNLNGQPLGTAMCIASACMAWRKVDQIGIGPNGEKRDRDMDGRTQWVDRGYCGAFGPDVVKP